MVSGNELVITHAARRFTYEDACLVAREVRGRDAGGEVRLGLERVRETSTAALARLIVLRRELLRTGRELRIGGLRGRAMAMYELSRMAGLLPLHGGAAPARP